MACVKPDGTIGKPGIAILAALRGNASAEVVASVTRYPLYRVRSVIRELVEGDLAKESGDGFVVTAAGLEKIDD